MKMARNNPHLDTVRKIAATENAVVVPVCAAIESEIELDDADKKVTVGDWSGELDLTVLFVLVELLNLQTSLRTVLKKFAHGR